MSSWSNCVLSWSIACQVGQLRVELVKLHVNYAKREHQSQLESHPANIFPMKLPNTVKIHPIFYTLVLYPTTPILDALPR